MTGRFDNGLWWAQSGDVRVVLYAGCDGGTVQIMRGNDWALVRVGDVTHSLVIELALEAARARQREEVDGEQAAIDAAEEDAREAANRDAQAFCVPE